MRYDIKRGKIEAPQIVLSVRPDGDMTKSIMGENIVTFTFGLTQYIDIKIGDWVIVHGEFHKLNRKPAVTIEKGVYTYNCVFEAVAYDLNKPMFMALTSRNTFEMATFAFVGTLEDFAKMILRNANRTQSGWLLGQVDPTETKLITFKNEKVLQVLSKVAVEFNTEFWILDKTIHLTKSGNVSGLVFDYGYDSGLYTITKRQRENTNVFTRLYVYGGTKNLKEGYRDYSQRLMLPVTNGTLNPDGTITFRPYIDKAPADAEIIEHILEIDEIFPRRTGTVTFAPPEDIHRFSDATMDFDVNAYLLPGESVKVTFQTGQLAGFTFELREEGGYDDATKTFWLLPHEEEGGIVYPTPTLRPMAGDTYVLTDLFMPDAYVVNAEQELLDAGMAYYDKNTKVQDVFDVVCDPIYFKRKQIFISIGSFVQVRNLAMGIDVQLRVVRLTRDIAVGSDYRLELSETFTIPQIVRQYAEQDKLMKLIARQFEPVAQLPPTETAAGAGIPSGCIMMWPFPKDTIPEGWREYTGFAGRFPIGAGLGLHSNTNRPVGSVGGVETAVLAEQNLPRMRVSIPIGHMASDMNEPGAKGGGWRDLRSGKWTDMWTNYFGGGVPHENMPPWEAVYFIQKI